MNKNQHQETVDKHAKQSPKIVLWRGVAGYCPCCGQGELFKGYLKQVDTCNVCMENIGCLKADDGPAWLTILIMGHLISPFIVYIALYDSLPLWLMMSIIIPVIVVLTLLLLPRSKGFFISALWLIKNSKNP